MIEIDQRDGKTIKVDRPDTSVKRLVDGSLVVTVRGNDEYLYGPDDWNAYREMKWSGGANDYVTMRGGRNPLAPLVRGILGEAPAIDESRPIDARIRVDGWTRASYELPPYGELVDAADREAPNGPLEVTIAKRIEGRPAGFEWSDESWHDRDGDTETLYNVEWWRPRPEAPRV